MFQQFIVTRFNLRLSEWKRTKRGDDILSESWLKKRFQLFETYCLPSVAQQTNTNFTWLVFFDIATPEVYKTKISEYTKNYPNFTPVFLKAGADILQAISKEINIKLTDNDTHIITTRLDNDDALHQDFIAHIQQQFIKTDRLVIDVSEGYQLHLQHKKTPAIRGISFAFNPFVSIIESRDNFKTILSKSHLSWQSHPHHTIANTPLWLQVIHNDNISNAESLQFKETNVFTASHFGIQHKMMLKSNTNILWSNFCSFIKRILIKLKIVNLSL